MHLYCVSVCGIGVNKSLTIPLEYEIITIGMMDDVNEPICVSSDDDFDDDDFDDGQDSDHNSGQDDEDDEQR